jgi:hypothetical protein
MRVAKILRKQGRFFDLTGLNELGLDFQNEDMSLLIISLEELIANLR